MIQKLEIERFRCYKHLSISGFKTFNLIVGGNGSGKTALLEAMFLAASASPDAYMKTRAWRGLGLPAIGPDRVSYETFFKNLFTNFDTDAVIEIRFNDNKRGDRSLTIGFGQGNDRLVTLPLRDSSPQYESTLQIPIQFEWKSPEGGHKSGVEVTADEVKFTQSNNFYPAVFVTPFAGNALASDSIQRFSQLSRRKQEGRLIATVAKCFPKVEGLSIELENGVNVLSASVSGLAEKIPVGMVSSGIHKFIAVILAILYSKDGAVLIDELENGLYYKILPQMTRTLLEQASAVDCQIFASTHSMEFLELMGPLIEERPNDFSLTRIESTSSGSEAVIHTGRSLFMALNQKVDVR